MRIDIWSDIACPWCYIGKARFDKALADFSHRDALQIVHRSFELEPHRAKGDTTAVIAMLTKKYGITPRQAMDAEAGLSRYAAAEGLTYLTKGRDHGNTFDLHRLLHLAKEHARQEQLLGILFRANFGEARSLYTDANPYLVELAAEAGLDPDAVSSVLATPDAYADEVRADEQEAAEQGASGVPFFVFDGAYSISGSQPIEGFTQALQRAWDNQNTATIQDPNSGETCAPDGCAVPTVAQ